MAPVQSMMLIVVMVSTVKPTASRSSEEIQGPFKAAKTLKQGSVLDLLKAPGETQPHHQHAVATTLPLR